MITHTHILPQVTAMQTQTAPAPHQLPSTSSNSELARTEVQYFVLTFIAYP